jgi:hypothetical protein
VRSLGLVVRREGYAAGGHRGPDRTPEVERAAPLGVVLLGEPGGEPARVRRTEPEPLLEGLCLIGCRPECVARAAA